MNSIYVRFVLPDSYDESDSYRSRLLRPKGIYMQIENRQVFCAAAVPSRITMIVAQSS